MARVLTNYSSFIYAKEASLGVLPATPLWVGIEPNTIGQFGATYSKESRSPISLERQRLKGTVTKVESGVEFEADLTMESFYDFLEGFVMAEANGAIKFGPRETNDVTAATGGVTDTYTVVAGGALTAATLVYGRGFLDSANNGLKVVDAGSNATTIPVTTDLEDEAAPPAKAIVEVCGVRGATGDLEIDASGDLISTVLDLTTLGLTAGQAIRVGGDLAANQFAVVANTGFARVTVIAAHKLTLDKKATTFAIDNGAGKDVDIFFGKFFRNVPVDDADFLDQSYQFEALWTDLQNPTGTGDEYEYAKGNKCNEMSFRLPLSDLARINFGFIGTTTDDPTTSRDAEASSAIEPLRTTAFNTSADVLRLRVTETDETGLTTDFADATLIIRNNASGEYVIGQTGPKYINVGNLEVDLDATVIFTDSDVLAAINANTTVTMDFALRNQDDGAIFVDLPAVTLGDGARDLPRNESVKLRTKVIAHKDTTLETCIGISLFPYIPSS